MSLRRLSIVFVAAAALTALSVQAAGAQEASGLHLRPTGGTAFPDRAYVLSLPSEAYLPPGAVVVRENGKIVKGVTVVPASTAQSGQFGVVLVIDASNSMRGDAIAGATAAARAFADNRQPGQSFAIVTFNKKTNVALPLTTDSEAIDAVLAAPPTLAHDTHLYDAVGQAVSMLEDGNVTVRSVVVLSDGADTGSAQSLEEVSSAAQAAGVRVFTVGLRSGAFDPTALQDLARQAGGQYSEARRPSDLEPIFGQLGSRLASEYLIRYKSTAPANKKVFVAVTVEGYPGVVTAGYASPSVSAGEPPFERSELERFVRSGVGMLTTVVLVALLIALAFHVLIRPRTKGVRGRLAEFVSLPLGKPTASTRQQQREAALRSRRAVIPGMELVGAVQAGSRDRPDRDPAREASVLDDWRDDLRALPSLVDRRTNRRAPRARHPVRGSCGGQTESSPPAPALCGAASRQPPGARLRPAGRPQPRRGAFGRRRGLT